MSKQLTEKRTFASTNQHPVEGIEQEIGVKDVMVVLDVTLYKWRNEDRNKGIAVPGNDIKSDNGEAQDKLGQLSALKSGVVPDSDCAFR